MLTVNFECIVDFHFPRRLLAEDRKHEEELVEALRGINGAYCTDELMPAGCKSTYQASRVVGGKHMADPFAEGIFLKKRRLHNCKTLLSR